MGLPRRIDEPNATLSALECMVKDGRLQVRFEWLVKRIADFRVGISDCGKFLHEGELVSENQIKMVLKSDFRRAFPNTTHGLADHLVLQAWKQSVAYAKKQMTVVPDGHREDLL